MKICSKTQQIAPIKLFFRGSVPPNPPSKRVATPRVTSSPPNNSWPPLANTAYAHELLLRSLFENPPWQTVDCVYSTLYVYALQHLFRGQKMTKIVAQHILKCITWALFSNSMCPYNINV